MKRVMLQSPKRATGSVCQLCQFSSLSSPFQAALYSQHSERFNVSSHSRRLRRITRIYSPSYNGNFLRFASTAAVQSHKEQEALFQDMLREYREISNSTTVPSDESVLQFLRKCGNIVNQVLAGSQPGDSPTAAAKDEDNAITSLLDLEEPVAANKNKSKNKAEKHGDVISKRENFTQKVSTTISSVLNDLLKDPKVFITPEILTEYTNIQTALKKTEHFPEIFSLYATKPIPTTSGSTITYRTQNNKSVKNAIPEKLATQTLDVAIEQKNLSLCLAIIDKSFCMPAYYRSKIFRKATVPLAGLGLAPAASYVCASYIASVQSAMDPKTATWASFAGILAYITFTASVGMVAITTANDQMVRVVWAPGMPLRQRWLREEERLALDKVASAWGFKDKNMHGLEEGEEWESLREFIGMRGMILDKSDLMEGME